MMAEAPTPVPELDFSLLSTGLGILSTSPAWPEVEAALQRLEAGAAASDAGRAADIALVQEYARKLEREASTIGRALVAGAAIGAAVDGERRVRIHRGLEALSAGHSFRRLPSTKVEELLEELLHEVAALYGGLKLSRSYSLRKPRTLADWRRLVHKDIEAVEAAAPGKVDTESPWDEWSRQLLVYSRSRGIAVPSVKQLICAAGGIGPGAWLRLEPWTMTIRDWSRLVQGAMGVNLPSTDAPPAWAGAAALWALGFPATDPTLLRRVSMKTKRATPAPPAEPADAVDRFVRELPHRAPEVAAVIVTASGEQPHNAWLPGPPELAALMFTREDLSALLNSVPDFFYWIASSAARTAYLVVEVGADEAEPPALSRALRGPLASFPRVDMYPAPPRRTPQRPFVVAPSSPEELLRGLRTQAQVQAQANVQTQTSA